MSGPVVVIGFILLIPSVVGMLVGILTLVGVGMNIPSMNPETRTSLEAQQVPEPVITQVAANKPIDEAQLAALTPQQQKAVRDAQSSVSGPWPGKAKASPGAFVVAGGLCLFVIVVSFVAALLGWILIMRKRVLQCTHCGAVVPAS
jgi:hypothetical protein